MTCSQGCALLTGTGSIVTADDVETLSSALAFIPVDDHIVLDLRGVGQLTSTAARQLSLRLAERVLCAEAVVVSDEPAVSMQLVLGDVDRIVPVVPTVEVAVEIITVRANLNVAEVA